MTTSLIIIDAVGWLGAALVLLAYGLLSIQWINGNSYSYQALNVAGAVMLVINSYYLRAFPSVGVNAVWAVIALVTMLHEWWKGPAEAYKKVTTQFSKRINLRRITLKRIKLPNFRHQNREPRKTRPTSNGFGQTQLL